MVEMLLVGLVGAVVLGMLEASTRLGRAQRGAGWTPEALLREAMRGDDAATLKAEFRRSGVVPPERGGFWIYV
jgi:hypothetical protein